MGNVSGSEGPPPRGPPRNERGVPSPRFSTLELSHAPLPPGRLLRPSVTPPDRRTSPARLAPRCRCPPQTRFPKRPFGRMAKSDVGRFRPGFRCVLRTKTLGPPGQTGPPGCQNGGPFRKNPRRVGGRAVVGGRPPSPANPSGGAPNVPPPWIGAFFPLDQPTTRNRLPYTSFFLCSAPSRSPFWKVSVDQGSLEAGAGWPPVSPRVWLAPSPCFPPRFPHPQRPKKWRARGWCRLPTATECFSPGVPCVDAPGPSSNGSAWIS